MPRLRQEWKPPGDVCSKTRRLVRGEVPPAGCDHDEVEVVDTEARVGVFVAEELSQCRHDAGESGWRCPWFDADGDGDVYGMCDEQLEAGTTSILRAPVGHPG